jgi:hypothetical protein
MSLTLELSPNEEAAVIDCAEREGVSLSEYARRRLLPPSITDRHVIGKPFNIMQFAGAAPRPVAEIDAHIAEIQAGRDEWDQRDWRQIGLPNQAQP